MRHLHAFLLLLAILLAPFAPVLFSGEVIFPHDNSIEVGLDSGSLPHASRNFSDLSSSSIPELQHHLRGNRDSWIATWNPHVELGRPSWQINGLSKAFAITWLLSLASDDALFVYTWLTLITVLLTGTFAYLLLRDFGLHPAACSIGSLCVAMGVFTAYWLSFVMFISALCWTLALMWGIQRFVRKRTAISFFVVAFSTHALLLSSYPQQILWHGLLVACFTLGLLHEQRDDIRAKAVTTLQLAGALMLALLSVAPVYLDLALNLAQSSRLQGDGSSLLSKPPLLGPLSRSIPLFLAQWMDASWFGELRSGAFPVAFRGLVLTPVLSVLLALSFSIQRPAAVRLWQIFLTVFLLMSVSPFVYRGAVDLGLLISHALPPLAAATIPIALLAAHSTDRIIRDPTSRQPGMLVVACVPLLILGGASLAFPELLRPTSASIGLLFFVSALVVVRIGNPTLLVGLVGISSIYYAYPLFTVRNPDEIQRSSPLVELLQRETGDGSRYAWVFDAAGRESLLPPNQEILLGLRSIHTYNSMTSERYRRWAGRNAQSRLLDARRFDAFRTLQPWYSVGVQSAGIGALASYEEISPKVATLLAQIGDVLVYKPHLPPVLEGVFDDYSVGSQGAHVSQALVGKSGSAQRIKMQEDRLSFRLPTADAERLLVVSQQFHPQWRASSGERVLVALPVNHFFQGVVVPAGTTQVELRFQPYTRFAWIPHACFAFAALGLALRSAWHPRNLNVS